MQPRAIYHPNIQVHIIHTEADQSLSQFQTLSSKALAMTDLKVQSAILVKIQGEGQVVNDISIPSPEIGQLLVRTRAVGINPSDWMALDTFARPGAGMGYDFSGEVVEIGEGVNSRWSVGDRVAGFVHGCKSDLASCPWESLQY
jgi:NADPH-dependent curcumin reductase CurA